MWELIRQNRRKSFILFILMGACLLLLGYVIGHAYFGPPHGGISGLFFAAAIWLVLSLISYFAGDSLMLNMSGAKQVTPDVHPQLFNVVEEMRIAASLPTMPKVYIIDEVAPNAFATGRSPNNCAIAVTAGLLNKLNRDELQGVIAHEMSHVVNRDIMFMTFSGIMLGSIVLISQVFLRGSLYSGGGRFRSKSSGRGGAGPLIIIALALAILAPIAARLLYFAISRRREYLADASGVRLTRYPEGLASALEKISDSDEDMPHVNQVTAPMYIVNPLKSEGMKFSDLSSTHPPISERIRILRDMSQGAGFRQYQRAFDRIKGKYSPLIPKSGLGDATPVPIRAASPDSKSVESRRGKKRGLADLMRAVNQFVFVTCVCGLKFKIPPNFKKTSFPCPRCKREIKIPVAELAAAAAVIQGMQTATPLATEQPPVQAVYKRHGSGWESFNCSCGALIQLSPAFEGTHLMCRRCGRTIAIDKGEAVS